MKKTVIVIIILIFLVAFFLKEPASKEIRTRIIPNSNSEIDLKEKEEVKEIVIKFLKENYNKDKEKYINNINKNVSKLKNETKKINENVKVELVNHNFYNKTYNGNSVKNEKVLTLLVTINEGKGDNWWGSIYPEFLEVKSDEVIEYESYILKKIKEMKG